MIESLNARYRRAVTATGHFPTEQAPLKTLAAALDVREGGLAYPKATPAWHRRLAYIVASPVRTTNLAHCTRSLNAV